MRARNARDDAGPPLCSPLSLVRPPLYDLMVIHGPGQGEGGGGVRSAGRIVHPLGDPTANDNPGNGRR